MNNRLKILGNGMGNSSGILLQAASVARVSVGSSWQTAVDGSNRRAAVDG
jgi:hypothetical protein